eukprot:1668512-Prymnesium_polylepis.2
MPRPMAVSGDSARYGDSVDRPQRPPTVPRERRRRQLTGMVSWGGAHVLKCSSPRHTQSDKCQVTRVTGQRPAQAHNSRCTTAVTMHARHAAAAGSPRTTRIPIRGA